jgi:hypothetical protein
MGLSLSRVEVTPLLLGRPPNAVWDTLDGQADRADSP